MTLRERIWSHIRSTKHDWFSAYDVAKELSVPKGQVVRALNWQRDCIEVSQLNARIKIFRVIRREEMT